MGHWWFLTAAVIGRCLRYCSVAFEENFLRDEAIYLLLRSSVWGTVPALYEWGLAHRPPRFLNGGLHVEYPFALGDPFGGGYVSVRVTILGRRLTSPTFEYLHTRNLLEVRRSSPSPWLECSDRVHHT